MIEETKVTQEFIDSMKKLVESHKIGGLIESCSKSVVLFSKAMLGIELRAWQVKFLSEIQKSIDGEVTDRKFLALTSRQIGKTTAVSILALWACVFNKLPGGIFGSTQVALISISDDQAKKVVREIKKLIRLGNKQMSGYVDKDGKSLFTKDFFNSLVDESEPNNTTTVTFKSYNKGVHGEFLLKDSKHGSYIKSYPPTSIILGNTYSLILIDEAGKSDKMTDIVYYDYILPTGDEMDALFVFTSTPWVLSGFFYRFVNPNDDFEDAEGVIKFLFTLDSIQLEEPSRYARVKKQNYDALVLDGKKDEADRAYYCKFVKGETTYFNPEKVFKVFTDVYEPVDGCKDECDMGIDFGGQTTSRSVITITRLNEDGVIMRLYAKSYEVGKDITLLEDVEDLMSRFNVQRIIPDDCPAGWHIIERMKQKGWNVEPMNFRAEKVKKYSSFRAAMNRDIVRSYKDDNLKAEMLALQFSQGQRTTFIEHAPGYTDDLIDSFLMSAYFMTDDDETFNFYGLEYEDEQQ